MRAAATLLLVAVWGSVGCGPSVDEALATATAAQQAGDDQACQDAFRQGLERHPEDLDLLLFAADFYLHVEAEDHYKPRLALHYASRASRVEDRPEVAVALVRSLRAMGQIDDAEAELQRARAVHPDHPLLLAL